MTPESWSIKDVAEHLAIAQPQGPDQPARPSMKEPVKSGWKPEATDEQMLWYGIDRTNRQRTGEARVPTASFRAPRRRWRCSASCARRCSRPAKASQEDFRGRPFMGGGQDVYQRFR